MPLELRLAALFSGCPSARACVHASGSGHRHFPTGFPSTSGVFYFFTASFWRIQVFVVDVELLDCTMRIQHVYLDDDLVADVDLLLRPETAVKRGKRAPSREDTGNRVYR